MTRPKPAALAADQHNERVARLLCGALTQPVLDALSRDDVTEVYVNPDGFLWVADFHGRKKTGHRLDPAQIERVIRIVATETDQICSAESPSIGAELPMLKQRFHGVLPPQSPRGPSFNIRKKSNKIILLDDYVTAGQLSSSDRILLGDAIRQRRNMMIVGGTGTGKTTFANALLAEIAAQPVPDRCIILEDVEELNYPGDDVSYQRTIPGVRTLRHLVADSLRMFPNRVIVGELRDGSAYDWLKVLNTGHPGGFATIHANSALEGLTRLEHLILEATPHVDRRWISTALDLVVEITGHGPERRVSSVARIAGIVDDTYTLMPVTP
jgi:type IV secretion system protein TrbB